MTSCKFVEIITVATKLIYDSRLDVWFIRSRDNQFFVSAFFLSTLNLSTVFKYKVNKECA